jgi:Asp-tRNA(Asn)/Glu-tRNA(Gln) amidotransferase C subunit
MTWSKEERVAQLSRLLGITIADEDAAEVANRLDSLLGEMESLAALELSGIEPTPVFPDEDSDVG